MNLINLREYYKVYFAGDIHGNFEPMRWVLLTHMDIKDAVVIICGDIGMGFHKKNYYIDLLGRMNQRLAENNVKLCFLRGNHDNPDYFNNLTETCPELITLSNIIFLPDFSVIMTQEYNILTIGGARSIDRVCRTLNVDCWAGEMVPEPTDDFYEFLKENIKIDIVCTHTTLGHAMPFQHATDQGQFVEMYAYRDKNLKDDNYNERLRLNNIFYDLLDNGHNIKYWFYGHFHKHYEMNYGHPETGEPIAFIGLDMIRHNKMDIYTLPTWIK